MTYCSGCGAMDHGRDIHRPLPEGIPHCLNCCPIYYKLCVEDAIDETFIDDEIILFTMLNDDKEHYIKIFHEIKDNDDKLRYIRRHKNVEDKLRAVKEWRKEIKNEDKRGFVPSDDQMIYQVVEWWLFEGLELNTHKLHYAIDIDFDDGSSWLGACFYKKWTNGADQVDKAWFNTTKSKDSVTCKRCLGMLRTDLITIDN